MGLAVLSYPTALGGEVRITSRTTMEHGIASSSSLSYPYPSRSTSRSPDLHGPDAIHFQKIVRMIIPPPRGTIIGVERLPARFHRLYSITLTDRTRLVLSLPPSTMTRVLGHESRTIETEFQVLDLLAAQTNIPSARKLWYGSTSTSPLRQPCLLRTYLPGTPLSQLSLLSPRQRADVDRQLGQHLRAAATVTAPRFGSLQRAFSGQGHTNWRSAFLSMFESVLRDAEDSLVSLPYDAIRTQLAERQGLLDDVKIPQLCLLDAGDEKGVLVEIDATGRAVVTGLAKMENVVFGDPMMASWAASATGSFWEGWGSCPLVFGRERERMML